MTSLYKKFNDKFASQGPEVVARQVKEHWKKQRIPPEFLNKLDISIQAALGAVPSLSRRTRQELEKNEATLRQQGIDLSKSNDLNLNSGLLRFRAYESLCRRVKSRIRAQPWPALLTIDVNNPPQPSPALLARCADLLATTPEELLAPAFRRVADWWRKYRAAGTSIDQVLSEMKQSFCWPQELPEEAFLAEWLSRPETLALPQAETLSAVTTFLGELRAAQEAERKRIADLERARKEAEAARKEAARLQAIEIARRQKEAQLAAQEEGRLSLEHLQATGRFADSDKRTWRKLAEVAELIGMSSTTVRNDVKKGKLKATGYTKGYVSGRHRVSPTSLHDRPAIRAYITQHRPKLDQALADRKTDIEQEHYRTVHAADLWQELTAGPNAVLKHGCVLAPSSGWPSAIELVVAANPTAAQSRFLGFSGDHSTAQALTDEASWLATTFQELFAARASVGGWSHEDQDLILAHLETQLSSYTTAWPELHTPATERKRLDQYLEERVYKWTRSHPQEISRIVQVAHTDPLSWYPAARALKRHWVLHLGPTNSGKTHEAMASLLAAPSGIYLAPLRLMALEGFDRLVEAGVSAALVTGEERRTQPESLDLSTVSHISATIEAGLDEVPRDVAVIDEAQMVIDDQRGWAWAQALAGVLAKEIHVCAAPNARPMLVALAEKLGEPVTIVEHARLTPLAPLSTPVKLKELTKGDALVVFSRRQLLGYRNWLRDHGHRVAVIYGDLGPEVRRAEADRFRSGRADILVATDAIGMGLNLPIRRVVFADTEKFDGRCRRPLLPAEGLQIAGRAGRHGLYEQGFYGVLRGATPRWSPDQIEKISLAHVSHRPHRLLVRRLGAWLGWTSIRQVADFWASGAHGIQPSSRWCERGWIDLLARTSLSLEDQFTYLGAPISKNTLSAAQEWIRLHAKGQKLSFGGVDVPSQVSSREDLEELENLSAQVRLYRWFALHFPTVYIQDVTALHVELSNAITTSLAHHSLANLCDSCGDRLPVGHPHANCDACFSSRRGWGYDEWC